MNFRGQQFEKGLEIFGIERFRRWKLPQQRAELVPQFTDTAVDETGDIFTGYTFTLESGFPDEAIKIVLRSIVNSDKFVGEMSPFIDGSSAGGVK